MVKVLYTTPALEHPPAGGPRLSVENCIKALSKVSELHIVSRVSVNSLGGPEAQKFYENYCVNFLYSPSAGEFSSNRFLRKLQRAWIKFSDLDVNFILKYFDENKLDVLWCDRCLESSFDLVYKIKKKRPGIKLVCDTCAVYSRFILRELPYEESPIRKAEISQAGKRKEEEERILVNLADVTTAVSEIDALYFCSIAKVPERVKLFSNVVDIETYQQIPPPVDDLKKPCIYLAGTFYSPLCPMADAARWVIAKVLPLVRQQIQNIHFYIIGSGSDQILSDINDPNITITGKLPSVLPYLCHADVALVPLRFESGTRFKILEAGACKIPMVSTALGTEGLSVEHEKHILIADTPEDFATAIINLLTNPELCEELSENCYELIVERYSINALVKEAKEILNMLV